MSDSILHEHAGAVVTLTLNRPQARNALDQAMIDALGGSFAAIAGDPTIRCVVLRGSGGHFMAGGDVRLFASMLSLPAVEQHAILARLIERVHATIETIYRMPQPVVAVLDGAVAGFGLSLVGACDLAIAADTAYFTTAYRHLGVTPDGGGTYALPRVAGVKKAMELVLLGERFDAAEALRLGIVNRVVPTAMLASASAEIVRALLSGSAAATAAGKRLVNQSLGNTLARQLAAEAESFARCARGPDFAEGVRAFLEKRPPSFRDA